MTALLRQWARSCSRLDHQRDSSAQAGHTGRAQDISLWQGPCQVPHLKSRKCCKNCFRVSDTGLPCTRATMLQGKRPWREVCLNRLFKTTSGPVVRRTCTVHNQRVKCPRRSSTRPCRAAADLHNNPHALAIALVANI